VVTRMKATGDRGYDHLVTILDARRGQTGLDYYVRDDVALFEDFWVHQAKLRKSHRRWSKEVVGPLRKTSFASLISGDGIRFKLRNEADELYSWNATSSIAALAQADIYLKALHLRPAGEWRASISTRP
jgi:hypothetical protein